MVKKKINITAVIQARLNSSRFKNKILKKINGKEVIKILKKDNTESLTKKILIEEHKLYPKALNVVVNRLLLNEKNN